MVDHEQDLGADDDVVIDAMVKERLYGKLEKEGSCVMFGLKFKLTERQVVAVGDKGTNDVKPCIHSAKFARDSFRELRATPLAEAKKRLGLGSRYIAIKSARGKISSEKSSVMLGHCCMFCLAVFVIIIILSDNEA